MGREDVAVEVKSYRPVKKGTLDGFLDIFIPQLNWTIKGCGLFISGDKKWVKMPSRAYKDELGQTRYGDIIDMPKDMKDKFSASALKAYEKFVPEAVKEPDFAYPVEF